MGEVFGKITTAQTTASALLSTKPVRLMGMHFTSSATAGTIVLRDGGSTGTVMLTINTPAGREGDDITIPRPGLIFGTNMHSSLSNVDGLTVFMSTKF